VFCALTVINAQIYLCYYFSMHWLYNSAEWREQAQILNCVFMDCNAVRSETGMAQSSHVWDGGCSVIFSWKGFCNIDKESYHDALWTWTWIRPPWLCVCVCLDRLVFVLQQHSQYAVCVFSCEIWRAIYRLAWACASLPLSCSLAHLFLPDPRCH